MRHSIVGLKMKRAAFPGRHVASFYWRASGCQHADFDADDEHL